MATPCNTGGSVPVALSHRCLAQSHAGDASYVGCRAQLIQCRKKHKAPELVVTRRVPGTESPNRNVAEACAKMLNELK